MANQTQQPKKKKTSVKEWFSTLPQRTKEWYASTFHPTPQQKARRKKLRKDRRAKRKAARKGLPVCLRILRGFFGLIVGSLLVVMLTSALVVGAVAVFWVSNFDAEAYCPDLSAVSQGKRSVIWVQDENGEWVPHHNLEGGSSVWVDLEDIPLNMQNAIIAIEDERFRDHEGVDWKRTAGAMINLVANRAFGLGSTEYGGSTITQQLIKVTTQQNDHSIKRKVNEILTASYMESSKYTKDEILEGYLNNVPLTGDLVGVGIGAREYFGKELEDLSLAECAVLASITNNPSTYNPYTHPDNVRQRQRLVLGKMYEVGFITKDEYVQALNEELVYQSSAVEQEVQDYYVDLVIEDVIRDLMAEYDYTYNYAQNLVYYGGLNIYSAENPETQAKVQAIFTDEANFPAPLEGDEEQPQAAFFCVDYNGKVIATVGGRGEKTANRVLNRSTSAIRSPGSSIKPLAAYSLAIKNNRVHYSSILQDAPVTLSDGTKWPKNYGQEKPTDRGDVLLGVALQKSLNTTAVRLVEESGTQEVFNFLTNKFHLSTLVTQKVIDGKTFTDVALAPLSLGAFSDGVTARDMAAAYAVFGNGGYYNEPYTYYYVTRAGDGENATHILDKGNLERGGCNTEVALDPQSAYVMNALMQRVIRIKGATGYTNVGEHWKDWQVFGKTGTSEDDKDVYFCAGTPYYCASTWFGYDNNQELSTSSATLQTGHAKILWNKAMKVLHEDLQVQEFKVPAGVEELEYCTKTGLIATPSCKSTDTGVYKTSFKPDRCTCGNPQPVIPSQPSSSGSASSTTTTTLPTTATTTTTPQPTTGDNNTGGNGGQGGENDQGGDSGQGGGTPSGGVPTIPTTPSIVENKEDENGIPIP